MCTVYKTYKYTCGSCGKPNNEQEMLKVNTMNTQLFSVNLGMVNVNMHVYV